MKNTKKKEEEVKETTSNQEEIKTKEHTEKDIAGENSSKEEVLDDESIQKKEQEDIEVKEPEIELSEEEKLRHKMNDINDKYLRLSAEFDNYRKRTAREKMDLIKTAGEDIFTSLLPVIDDFERAIKTMENAEDVNSVKQGVALIYTKFKEFLKSKGVKEVEAFGQEFNTDLHEAVTKIPTPDKKQKGKVVDVIEKGYLLNDKVIRYPKVVVGE